MRYKIENFDETSDARSFMNSYKSSCSYVFLKYVMYIIVITILAIVTWSVFAEKYIVVNASGIIDMKDNVCRVYIENTSIGKVKENDDILIEIVSLPRNEYGVIKSTIDSITDDVLVDEASKKKFYSATCKLDNSTLKDKNSEEVELKSGMEAEISIITYKTSYFNYILGKII